MKKKKIFITLIVIAIIAVITVLIGKFIVGDKKDEPIEISYTEFLQKIDSNSIDEITMNRNSSVVEANYKDTKKEETIHYIVTIPSEEAFINFIQEEITSENVDILLNIKDDNSGSNGFNTILTIGNIIYIVFILLMFRSIIKLFKGPSNSKKDSSSEKSKSFMNQLFDTDINWSEKIVKSDVTFADVAGLKEEKEELMQVVDFLKEPLKYSNLGAKLPKGILLSGAPGTGKTLLAKAVAGEAGVNYLAIAGSEFEEKYVGVGASRIRKLFDEVRKKVPCIIFIDEIDAVGSKRIDDGRFNQTLEQLLIEMDGFQNNNDIIILAATNRLSALDSALTRPGRFDRKIHVHLPDVDGREEILRIHAKGKHFAHDIDFREIAQNTSGYSGAELANLMNEAALIAAKEEHDFITNENIYEALKKVTIGLEKSGKIVSEKERYLTATHEAGHAVVARLLNTQSNIKEVSIVPRGTAGGYTWQNRGEEKSFITKKELEEKLTVLLAGRTAENIMIGDISSGASNDLEVATSIAKQMISFYGMDDEIGPLSLSGLDSTELKLLGEKTLSNIGTKVSELLKNAENKAEKLLTDHKNLPILATVTEKLLEKETISGEELDRIFRENSSCNLRDITESHEG